MGEPDKPTKASVPPIGTFPTVTKGQRVGGRVTWITSGAISGVAPVAATFGAHTGGIGTAPPGAPTALPVDASKVWQASPTRNHVAPIVDAPTGFSLHE